MPVYALGSKQGWDWIATNPPINDCNEVHGDNDQSFIADWVVNSGDLVAGNQLHSAVIIQLFTEKRIPKDQSEYIEDDYQRGGYWGDSFAPFEIGSHLWTLQRAALTDATVQDAYRFAREALQPLQDQGAFARFEVDVKTDKQRHHLYIVPRLYGQDGQLIYQKQFSRFWR